MTDETTQNLATLATRFVEELRSYNLAQDEARGQSEIGYQIAMRGISQRLLELRQSIDEAGGVIEGKSVFGADGQVLASLPIEPPSSH